MKEGKEGRKEGKEGRKEEKKEGRKEGREGGRKGKERKGKERKGKERKGEIHSAVYHEARITLIPNSGNTVQANFRLTASMDGDANPNEVLAIQIQWKNKGIETMMCPALNYSTLCKTMAFDCRVCILQAALTPLKVKMQK
jgi:hypothetical protein